MVHYTVTKKEKEVPNNKISDDDLIKGILNNDSKTIHQIYVENFEKIKVMVLNFNHIRFDPQDVFQEGLTRAILNVRKSTFKGESKFSTYLYSICRIICLKEYKDNKRYPSNENFELEEKDQDEDNYFEILQQMIRIKNSLSKKCKEIIDLRFNLNHSKNNTNKIRRFENIAIQLGINPDNARQRFKRCLAKLRLLALENLYIKQSLS
jgi:RNA polymerase sigma factor (sigma-70 family)